MPMPIIHLCVAKKILEIADVQNKAGFYLGSISPDAFYITPTYYDVDGKYEAHIKAHITNSDFDAWKKDVIDFMSDHKTDEDYAFYLGYGIHILTDIKWKETVIPAFSARCAERGVLYDESRSIYYNDMEMIDPLCYDRYKLQSDVWEYLSGPEGSCFKGPGVNAPGVDNLVTAKEIDSWRENTLSMLKNKRDLHDVPADFFTYDMVSGFIENAAKQIALQLVDMF